MKVLQRAAAASLPAALLLFVGSIDGLAQVSEATARSAVLLRPGDQLEIRVWPEEEMGGEFVVEETGLVHLPFLGEVQAAGVPFDRLRDEIRAGFQDVVRNAVVTILPTFSVGLLGEVRAPGIYLVSPSTSLLDVIGLAGGFTLGADRDDLRILRDNDVVRLDAERAMEMGAGALRRLQLQSGDNIVVPARGAGIRLTDVFSALTFGASMALLIDQLTRR